MSVTYCSVDGCMSKTGTGISFFRCPRDETRCQLWKNILGFTGSHRYAKISLKQCNTRIKICSLHFSPESFTTSDGRKHISYNAVPSLALPIIKDMASVEQCETQSSGLSSLPKTLYDDSFKPCQEEEKDSDEESFHLPMLDCDDDLDSKETLRSDIGKDLQNDETEDEILNKFETNGTPDIDPKLEDSILDEIDNLFEKKIECSIDKNIDSNKELKDVSGTVENKLNIDEKSSASETLKISEHNTGFEPESESKITVKVDDEKSGCGSDEFESKDNVKADDEKPGCDSDKYESKVNVKVDDEKSGCGSDEYESKIHARVHDEKPDSESDKHESKINEKINADKPDSASDESESNINENINDDKEKELDTKTITENTDGSLKDVKTANENIDMIDETVVEENIANKETTEEHETNKMDVDPQLAHEKIVEDKISRATNNSNETEFSEINSTVPEVTNLQTSVEVEQDENELEKCIEPSPAIEKPNSDLNDIESKSSNGDTDLQTANHVEAMEIDNKEEGITNEDNSEKISDTLNEISSKNDILCEDSKQCQISNITNSLNEEQKTNNKQFREPTTESATADNVNSQSSAGPDKCENSNDSSKSQNLECDDLLDISIIRDADEDNANAIAENANDAHTSEKSDDNDDQDEGSDKAENELDESEMDQDQDDTLLANDKDDNMDFEDGSSNLLSDQDNVIDGNISDSENKNNEIGDSENDSKDSNSVLNQKSDINDIEFSEKNSTEDISISNTEAEGTEDSIKENTTKSSGKRSLSDTDITQSPNKKIKLTERSKTEDKILTRKNDKVKTLINFEKYMQNKKLENKLTRSDLEQFCLQKICEAIMHKTDVGELHQTIKKQEQIIENLRKDLQQLTKQTRDLDIVNKKLMNELRAQNGPKKPLVPLKITRSVGLQVKLNTSTEVSSRRKAPVPTTPRTPTNNTATTARPRTIAPANAAVVRQVAASPRKTPASAPLLSQALQNRVIAPANNVAKRTPVRPKVAEPQKPANASVIDLTDEDDRVSKASKGVVGNSVKILNKTIPLTTQGKTINIIPAKTVPNKMLNSNQNKTVAVGQVKTTVGTKVGTPTRTVAALPQGVRLTPTQVKNGSIAIPASVVTSNSGTTQFMYVVQPGSVVTSTAGGTQKAVLLNFQPTNGVLTSTINGSAVSVLPSKTSNTVQLKTVTAPRKHPAPLPSPPPITVNASLKPLLPKPHLSIRKTDTGIILQWRMPYNLDMYEAIASYQLFAYQETNAPPSTEMWRKVGDVKALALPMACTLTQFADKNKYYFAVRSIDVHKRIGAFSEPEEISL